MQRTRRLAKSSLGVADHEFREAVQVEGVRKLDGRPDRRRQADEHCVTHDLRKAAARRLAEAGCSANEIAAITGHKTLEEVGRYT